MLIVDASVTGLLKEFRQGLEPTYGPRLRGVYLYGSRARGEAEPESDVDVLVVLEDFEDYGNEIDRTGALGAGLCLKHGVTVSRVFLREREWLHGDSPFLANVREEAIPA